MHKDGSALEQIAGEVRSGDPSNRESLAARIYFPMLSPGYTCDSVCPLTSALNNGYAVVRSTLARHVVSHGFITSVGLHHANGKNEFNFVDDMIEPFRPIVDLRVMGIELEGKAPSSLSRNARKQITGVLRRSCDMDGHETSVLIAAELCVESLARALEEGDAKLLSMPRVAQAGLEGEG